MPPEHLPRRVCFVLLTGLGDVVHGLPIACALKRAGVKHISWVAEPMPAALLAGHPCVDNVVVYNKRAGVPGIRELAADLRGLSFDVTLNFNIYFKSVWPTVLSRAPRRIGFDRDRARELVWLAANEHLPARPRRHTQDMFLEFADALGVDPHPLQWRLELTESEQAERDSFLAPLRGRRIVAIIPASANQKKDWIAERFARVAEALHNDYGCHVLLLGGPGARENDIARAIRAEARVPLVDAMGDGVRRVVAIISGCALVIGPDTGPLHIARALDIPVIGLFGHTNPWRVGPYRKYEDLWVDAYTDRGEEPDPSNAEPRLGRMQRITVEDVLARVHQALG